jgi:putative ABC transport system permease protein
MNNSIDTIPLINLSLAFIPAILTIGILFRWSLNSTNALYAISRMLIQLLLIGYFLTYIFDSDSAGVIILILAVMVMVSSWIALGTIPDLRMQLYKNALLAITVGGGITLAMITQGVLALDPWYSPQSMIPIAGMIFANAMNSVSLCAERLSAEVSRQVPYDEARKIALQSSLIPVTNALFAVRYQIMVMCMVFGASGIASAYFLVLVRPAFERKLAGLTD